MATRGSGSRDRVRPRGRGGGGTWRTVRLIVGIAIGIGLSGLAALVGLFLYYGADPKLPNLRGLGDYRPRQVTRVLDREGRLIGEIGAERRTLVPIARIPKPFLDAVIAAEDPTFYQHQGLDYRGILRAVLENLMQGRFAQGGSTITQQVVKQMLLSRDKTLRRKVQEWILARRISSQLSKQEILEVYVNHNNYGHGRYGCEEAARYYFGKPIADVTLAEAALLAGLPQSPERLSPRKHPEAAKARQRYVLEQMVRHGYLDRPTAERAWAPPIVLAPDPGARPAVAPEAVGSVHRRLIEEHGAEALQTLGATVKTTIDVRLQELARQALERGLEDLDQRQGYRGPSGHLAGKALEKHRAELAAARKGGQLRDSEIVEAIVDRVDKGAGDDRRGQLQVDLGGGLRGLVDLAAETRYAAGPRPPLGDRFKPGDLVRVRLAPERRRGDGMDLPLALELGPQSAMVVMDPQTRDVLALVGGYGYRPGGFDRSQRASRQPGSAFKPFLYGAAVDSGRFTAASLLNDAPEVYDLWKPQNHERDSFRGPVRLRVALAHSINTVAIRLLADLGLPAVREFAARAGFRSELPDSIGLALALGANAATPLELANATATLASGGMYAEPRLVMGVGDQPAAALAPQPMIRPETAFVVVSLMRSVVEEGTARAAGLRLRRPLAGKTGTSDDNKDAWFVGFTPDLLVAVWVGFDDNKKLGRGEVGGRAALPIWIEFMAKALAGRPVRDFVQPPGIVVTRIDPATGLLATPGSEGLDEVFVNGTAPTQVAPAQGEEASPDKLLLERNAP